MKPPASLETKRLLLRQPVPTDGISVFEKYAQDPEVTKYLCWQPHNSIKSTDEYIDRCIEDWLKNSAFPYALIRKKDAQLIGMIEIRINRHKADLGYVLARPEWGKGYMPEATKKLIEWALEQEKIYRIWAVCDVENIGSARVMEKVGMQREGILRRWLVHPNISTEPRDCYC